MAILRRAALATVLVGTGLAATTGSAFAGHNDDHHQHHHGTEQNGLLNVSDVQTIVPLNACNNNVPVNVGGVQVPLQDITANIPLLSPVDHHSSNGGTNAKSCRNGVAAEN